MTTTTQKTTPTERWVLILSSIASLMVALDVLVVSTALGAIRHHLGASLNELEWTVNAYGLSFAVLLIGASSLGDRFGRRRLFAAGLGLFVAGSVACALAPSAGLLIAARAAQGAAAALIAPLSLSLLGAAFGPQRRAWALGIYSGITGLAVLGGPVVGGAVTQGLAWQWIFWINVPIGLAAIPLVLTRVPESYGPRARFDVPGLVLVSAAALGIVWGLMRGNDAGWDSLEVVGALAAGLIAFAAFVSWEARTREPMLPLRLFSSRGFALGSASNFLLSACLFSAVFFMAQFQQISLHQGPLDSGLRLLPWTATLFIVAPIAGSLVGRVGERPLVVAGLLLQAAGMAWIALVATPGMAYVELVAPLAIAGAGISMAIPAVQNAVMNAVSPGDLGNASGVSMMTRQLGGVFGVAIGAAVFSGAGSYASASAFGDGFGPALAVAAAFSLLGAASAVRLPRRAGVAVSSPGSGAGRAPGSGATPAVPATVAESRAA